MNDFLNICKKYKKTDKITDHSYNLVYSKLSEIRNDIKYLLEIGVMKGDSLRVWKEFFPNAEIHGIDKKIENIFKEERITCFRANQNNIDSIKLAVKDTQYDIIIDDGSHIPKHQISCAKFLIKNNLKLNGKYFIEDIHPKFLKNARIWTKNNFEEYIIHDLRKKKKRFDDICIEIKKTNELEEKKQENKIIIGTVLADHPNSKKWYKIQHEFIKKNTNDFEWIHVVSSKTKPEFLDEKCVWIKKETECNRDHANGIKSLINFFLITDCQYCVILDSDALPIKKNWATKLSFLLSKYKKFYAAPIRF